MKLKAIAYLGGACKSCGYDRCADALEFHHRDPTEKDFGLSANGYYRSFERVKAELDKCDLLCANCHREVHAEWKALGISKRKIVENVPWPSKEELQRLVWEKPMVQIAVDFGVARHTVQNWRRRLGVSNPPHGHWLAQTRRNA